MLQDTSPDFEQTWTFLSNRIQDVVNVANTAKQVQRTVLNSAGVYFTEQVGLLTRAGLLQVQSTGEAVVQGLMGAAVTVSALTYMRSKMQSNAKGCPIASFVNVQ